VIFLCADDYGLCKSASESIQRCIDAGVIDKVSVFPNIDQVDLAKILSKRKIRTALHINLVEGMCMADAGSISLIADESGKFKHTFFGLFQLNLFHPKELEEQVYREIKAQVSFWKGLLPPDTALCIDSHQHTHMIPAVFRALLRVLQDEKITLKHLRIPAEPIMPYIKVPSLYLTYSPINLIKQWLLKFLWQLNKTYIKEEDIPYSYFFGILFSGKMDEKRVRKILPHYIKIAEKSPKHIEVLFHPGYHNAHVHDANDPNITFTHFYLSPNRKTEYDSVLSLSERSVV
jgi:predicted glycoside hydrolase/deacetylase ChbG (UPF0249 family)